MPFHDITELPAEFCEPKTAKDQELSVGDRIQITELLHCVYLCEDSRDYDALKKILVDDYINEHPLFVGQNLGSYATISVATLPEAQNQRLGGRQSSSLY
jgi:hypothetical protein